MDKTYDVAIIGSGPSGLTAAIYTTRGAASTIIFGGESWGGQLQLTSEVDNFPTQPGIMGPDLMQKMKDHALMFGAEFVQKNVTAIDVSKKPSGPDLRFGEPQGSEKALRAGGHFKLTSDGRDYFSRSIIIATGAETVWLDVPGLQKLIGRGVSSCAPCDAPFFRNKKVAVVGGGDSAMEEALYLTKYTDQVFIVHRRDTFKASVVMQEKVLNNPKIKILWDSEIVEVIGEAKLEQVKIKNNKTLETSELLLDGLFVAIGHSPSSMVFKGKIDLDDHGYVIAHERTKTSVPGIFVAGDVEDIHYKQAITASGFGCMAGMDCLNYLSDIK